MKNTTRTAVEVDAVKPGDGCDCNAGTRSEVARRKTGGVIVCPGRVPYCQVRDPQIDDQFARYGHSAVFVDLDDRPVRESRQTPDEYLFRINFHHADNASRVDSKSVTLDKPDGVIVILSAIDLDNPVKDVNFGSAGSFDRRSRACLLSLPYALQLGPAALLGALGELRERDPEALAWAREWAAEEGVSWDGEAGRVLEGCRVHLLTGLVDPPIPYGATRESRGWTDESRQWDQPPYGYGVYTLPEDYLRETLPDALRAHAGRLRQLALALETTHTKEE